MFYKVRYASTGFGSGYNLIVESEKEFELNSLVFVGIKPATISEGHLYIDTDAVACFITGKLSSLEELPKQSQQHFKDNRCIIGVISCPEYDELLAKKEKAERMFEIRTELEEKAKQLEKDKLYAFYASQDEEFAKLLNEFKELKNDVE